MTECPTGKVGYPSPQAAWQALGHVRHRIRTTGTKHRHYRDLHAYRCQFCRTYHLSGTPDPRRRTA